MSTLGLIRANLFRKRTRSVLTLLSLTIAFLLFVLLRTVAEAFAGGVSVAGADRLIVSPKYSIIDSLTIAQAQQIARVEGVDAVTSANWFGGVYQDPRNFFPKYPVSPREWFEMHPELIADPAVIERFANTRTGTMVSVGLAERFGWHPGDVIPIEGDIWARQDGTRLWEFELVGTYGVAPDQSDPGQMYFQQDYFEEAVADYGKGQVGWYVVRVTDPDRSADIASRIDALFENSVDPTKTATEDEYQRQFARQLGDIGMVMTAILGAVFFTIVLLTANTMSQALRERIPELAVLKTLGFTDARVALIVLGESVILCLIGGAAGIALALLLEDGIGSAIEQFTGTFEPSTATVVLGFAIAAGLGLLVGAQPAIRSMRLAIVDALRAR